MNRGWNVDGYSRRKAIDFVARSACVAATLFAVVPLVFIIAYICVKGAPSFNVDFFTKDASGVSGDPHMGMANAIKGTVTLVALASGFGVPIGVLAGVYLAEFGTGRFGNLVRFSADVMSGTPSIVAGLFVYALVVKPMHGPSAIAGGLALAILMLPTIMRTTEELLKLVPDALREGGLALGVPKWKVIIRVVLRTAAPGIATGVVLAVARVTGETAPLLFTALNDNTYSGNLFKPIASLTVTIYNFATSPYEDLQQQAWGGALVLVALVLVLNVSARLLVRQRVKGAR
jgi:phosphate transport system permease protein